MNIKAMLEQAATEENKQKAEKKVMFNGLIQDYCGPLNIGEIVESIESNVQDNAAEINRGRILPFIKVSVNPHTEKEADFLFRPERSIDRDKSPQPFLLYLTVKHPNGVEIALNVNEERAIAKTIANRIANKMRKDNPEVSYDELEKVIRFF